MIRDAIWGDVRLGARELALIDTPAFQRLRRIRQLGFTDLVFPGARHTRFEHSLGVYHVAGLALDRLAWVEGAPGLSQEDRATFLAAALLHDVGHYPFSHALEELEMESIERHEDIARDVITGELAGVLRDGWGVDPGRVGMLVAGPMHGSQIVGDVDGILRTLLDSGLDIDKLDYLVRDARGANVPYGMVDVQRLVGALTIRRDAGGRPRVAVEEKGLAALQSLVFAKHLMFASVYWHHACRAAVAMLLRGVQEALGTGGLAPDDLKRADDDSLVWSLSGEGMPELTRQLARRIRERRLYKRAVDVGVGDQVFEELERLWYRPEDRRRLEDGWARAIGAPPGSVLLDIPEPKHIDVDLPVVGGDGDVTEWDRASGLGSADLLRFQRSVRRIRVFAATREAAEALSRDLIAG